MTTTPSAIDPTLLLDPQAVDDPYALYQTLRSTVVRVQRLATVPAMVWIEDPGLRRGIPASKASSR